MSQEFLYHPQIRPGLEQMRGECVPESMWCGLLARKRPAYASGNPAPNDRSVSLPPARLIKASFRPRGPYREPPFRLEGLIRQKPSSTYALSEPLRPFPQRDEPFLLTLALHLDHPFIQA